MTDEQLTILTMLGYTQAWDPTPGDPDVFKNADGLYIYITNQTNQVCHNPYIPDSLVKALNEVR